MTVTALAAQSPHAAAAATSSVHTVNCVSVVAPNDVVSATSTASRPRANTMRPMRGAVCRASIGYQAPATYTSAHAEKSIGLGAAGTPMSPRKPVV